MAEDDKESFWSSLHAILTGLAAVMTAAGALIYHSRSNSKPKPVTVQQESLRPRASSTPSQCQLAPPERFKEQVSYKGDCASPPAESACVRFRDGYRWLVQDVVAGRHNQVGSRGSHPAFEASGKQARYQHILGTQYVKTAEN